MHRAHTGIVKACRHAVRLRNLSVFVLYNQRIRSVQHPWTPQSYRCGGIRCVDTFASCFGKNNLHVNIVKIVVNRTGSVAASAHASYKVVGIALACMLLQLVFYFGTYYGLQTGHHIGIRMGTHRGTDYIMCVLGVATPVANGFVGSVFQGLVSRHYRHYRSTEHFHFLNVQVLTFHICRSHVHRTGNVSQGTHRGGGNTVLSGSGFCHDTCLAHTLREQHLTERIVNLMCACMVKVFAFQINRTAVFFAQTIGKVQRRRPSGIVAQKQHKLLFEIIALYDSKIFAAKFLNTAVKNFGNIRSAIDAVISLFVH